MTLGDIIKNYRECKNITLGEFADASSLSKGYISMLENNINPRNNKPISPTLPSIAKVASGMGIELDVLLKMLDSKQSVQLVDDSTDSIRISNSIRCQEILDICEQLSDHNQKKVLTYSKNLLSAQQMEDDLLAAHARTDVATAAEDVQSDEDLMDDDSKWN